MKGYTIYMLVNIRILRFNLNGRTLPATTTKALRIIRLNFQQCINDNGERERERGEIERERAYVKILPFLLSITLIHNSALNHSFFYYYDITIQYSTVKLSRRTTRLQFNDYCRMGGYCTIPAID